MQLTVLGLHESTKRGSPSPFGISVVRHRRITSGVYGYQDGIQKQRQAQGNIRLRLLSRMPSGPVASDDSSFTVRLISPSVTQS